MILQLTQFSEFNSPNVCEATLSEESLFERSWAFTAEKAAWTLSQDIGYHSSLSKPPSTQLIPLFIPGSKNPNKARPIKKGDTIVVKTPNANYAFISDGLTWLPMSPEDAACIRTPNADTRRSILSTIEARFTSLNNPQHAYFSPTASANGYVRYQHENGSPVTATLICRTELDGRFNSLFKDKVYLGKVTTFLSSTIPISQDKDLLLPRKTSFSSRY